jgi:hypothetical protein
MLFHCPAPGTAAKRACRDADVVLASTLYPVSTTFGSGGRVGVENVTQKTDDISKWFRTVGSCDPLESLAYAPFSVVSAVSKINLK